MQAARDTEQGRVGASGFQDRCNSHSANPPSAAARTSYAATADKLTTSRRLGESGPVRRCPGVYDFATTSSTTTPPGEPRHAQRQRAGGVLAVLFAAVLAGGCEARATYQSGPADSATSRDDGLIVRRDSARGVVCYQVRFNAGLSCVIVRPDSGRVR